MGYHGHMYGQQEAKTFDIEHADLNQDVPFWLSLAETYVSKEGSVLELGCGTLRVGIPLIEAGYNYVGIDSSPEMLEVAERKLKSLDHSLHRNASLHVGDMTTFDLKPKRFDFIIVPLNSFLFAITLEQQMSLLQRVEGHLTWSGTFVFDVFVPDINLLNNFGDRWLSEPDIADDRYNLLREVRIAVDHKAQIINLTRRSRKYRERVLESEWMSQYRFTYLFPRELQLLLCSAGFVTVGCYSDYLGRDYHEDPSPKRQIVLAQAKAADLKSRGLPTE